MRPVAVMGFVLGLAISCSGPQERADGFDVLYGGQMAKGTSNVGRPRKGSMIHVSFQVPNKWIVRRDKADPSAFIAADARTVCGMTILPPIWVGSNDVGVSLANSQLQKISRLHGGSGTILREKFGDYIGRSTVVPGSNKSLTDTDTFMICQGWVVPTAFTTNSKKDLQDAELEKSFKRILSTIRVQAGGGGRHGL